MPDLIEELSGRVDAIITSASEGELEVWLLGSLTVDADRAEMEERLRNRRTARHAKVWVVTDEP